MLKSFASFLSSLAAVLNAATELYKEYNKQREKEAKKLETKVK